MEREEILAKSRQENKNRDVCDMENQRGGAVWGVFAMIVLGTIFFSMKICLLGEFDHGIYAMICGSFMATFWYKWWKLRKKHELWTAILYTIGTVCFTAANIINLLERI